MKADSYDNAHNRFLETEAPLPAGATTAGRWYAPGSSKGWHLVDTENPEAIYAFTAQWGDLLTFTVTPVFTDERTKSRRSWLSLGLGHTFDPR
ncbi:MAG: hypothetical protein CMJ75_07875 [Planctomycetaceae bacterium]|nr:hypothetical protein [Planctomycetaceae bacterium]